MKTYLGISRDHSGSMQPIVRAAARDYNATILATQRAAALNSIETAVSTVKCDSIVYREHTAVPIGKIHLMEESEYRAGGGTPLFESIHTLIDDFSKLPDANDPEVTFIVMATTDGYDTSRDLNAGPRLAERMHNLITTDRWTFVFRVPTGQGRELHKAKRDLIKLGIPEGNILEWDQTDRGVAAASAANDQAFAEFYTARASGVKSTKTFYTSTANLSESDVKKKLGDISAEVSLWPVSAKEDGGAIREFVEKRLKGEPMLKGAAFYQLVKIEDKIQAYKLIAIRDRNSGAVYCGPEARDLVGLSQFEDARVNPNKQQDVDTKWQIFVQSTSVNRKITGGTSLMYWPNVGKAFTEGPSAR